MSLGLHLRESGRGPPLVLVHGWGSNGTVWNPVLDALAAKRRVITVDLPGHGHSPAPPDPAYDLIPLLAQLVAEPADWVGWSLGGLLVQQLAVRYPAAVKRTVSVAAGPKFVATADWPCAVAAQLLEAFAVEVRRDPAAALARFAALQVSGGEQAGVVLRDWRRWQRAQPRPQAAALGWGLAQLQSLDSRAGLRELQSPCLFIIGDRDPLLPFALTRYLPTLNPALQHGVIAGAAHVPHWSHPTVFIKMLTEYCFDA